MNYANYQTNNNLDTWLRMVPELVTVHRKAYECPELVCPLPSDTFRALELVAPGDVRVIILGQDPYHTPGKASGIAFGYHRDYTGRLDSSLENILDEIDPLRARANNNAEFRTLEHWAKQGVLLINTRLTVEIGKPMSHAGIGWEEAVSELLCAVDRLHEHRVYWCNFGREAQAMCPVPVDDENRLDTSHPCRFSAHRGFIGSEFHLRANEYLESEFLPTINWYRGLK